MTELVSQSTVEAPVQQPENGLVIAENNKPNQQPASAPAKSKHAGIVQTLQAARLQRVAYDAVMALKADCTDKETGKLTIDAKSAGAIHKLVMAWDAAADRLRVLRGRGLPASVRTKQRQPVAVEPLPD